MTNNKVTAYSKNQTKLIYSIEDIVEQYINNYIEEKHDSIDEFNADVLTGIVKDKIQKMGREYRKSHRPTRELYK